MEHRFQRIAKHFYIGAGIAAILPASSDPHKKTRQPEQCLSMMKFTVRPLDFPGDFGFPIHKGTLIYP